MSKFLQLFNEKDKAASLSEIISMIREGRSDPRVFEVQPDEFDLVPGKPFAYWVSNVVRESFQRMDAFESDLRTVRQGLATAEDVRFVRTWWEVNSITSPRTWFPFAKGGAYSTFYADLHLVVKWEDDGAEMKAGICQRYPYLNGNPDFVAKNTGFYFRPGLTWTHRTTSRLGLRVYPSEAIFGNKGPVAFVKGDDANQLLELLAITTSSAFILLVDMLVAAADAAARSYDNGLLQLIPIPSTTQSDFHLLSELARRAWSMKRMQDTVVENSHAFILPYRLRARLGGYEKLDIRKEIYNIQASIDDIAFGLYGFLEEDRKVALAAGGAAKDIENGNDEGNQCEEAPLVDALLSWAAGVAFGRFDWRLAIGEREAPPEPEPFDPLPARSPGMLPDGAEPYYRHAGILVDDSGHDHDLSRLMADVLETVDAQVDEDLRRWLRRDFFKYHLQQYSKSRRKAPIYWPLATASGSYTLWLYYPDLTNQTLFTAVNDFVEPKLKQVDSELANLRLTGTNRSRADEKRLEELSEFRDELADLRDTLLRIAPGFKPNHDDGVQITAAPLWPLFRHKPWQKVLKETWEKLEQGDYDWAHLAMAYWPERVREKCVTDKSLAIAHDLERLYVEPEPAPKETRGRKKNTGSSE